MKPSTIARLCLLIVFVPTVTSLIISSVYAGKKKFKTISFGHPFLPAIVKVQPNKFHLTFRQNKYLRTPQFKIEGTIPLKAPTVVKEILQPDPYPEVTEYNFGDMGVIKGDKAAVPDQQLAYDNTGNYPTYAEPPKFMGPPVPLPPLPHPSPAWTPNVNQIHHRNRRFAEDYNNQFNYQNPNFGQNQEMPQNYANYWDNRQNFFNPNNHQNYQNYYNQNNGQQYSGDQNMGNNGYMSGQHQYSPQPYQQFYPNYQTNFDMSASPSSYTPVKHEGTFTPSNQQSNRWVPIDRPSAPAVVPQNPSSGYSSESNSNRKLNIGEHYNPSASYVDETVVEKPTYDPDAEPDEGSVSFSISGPHGGEEVPAGYEQQIKQMHEALKDEPHHLPPGLDLTQLSKYYTHHTFTDPLKNNYGYKAAFGPLGFLKNKLKSWSKFI